MLIINIIESSQEDKQVCVFGGLFVTFKPVIVFMYNFYYNISEKYVKI